VDSDLTEVWIPPVADKFYIYLNKDLDYSVGPTLSSMPAPTDKQYFCAKFDANGAVVPIVSPGNTVKTAWKLAIGPAIQNYGRNLFQYTEIP
jgi:hypothetical protein